MSEAPIGIRDLLELEVYVLGIEPRIRRRIHVAAGFHLDALHHVIQTAFAWQDQHGHAFRVGAIAFAPVDEEDEDEIFAVDEAAAPLGAVARVGASFEYFYGDQWRHRIEVVGVVARPKSPLACVEGARASPPEDCGGPAGHAELLEALASKRHPRHAELRRWVGRGYDPEKLDVKALNRKLCALLDELLRGA